jgi:hypothetical protein
MGLKFNKLKNVFVILSSLSLVDCSYSRFAELSEFRVEYDLILKNESSYDIKIFAFNKNEILDELELKNNQKILKRVSYLPIEVGKHNTNNIFKYDENLKGYRDSVIIVFDNRKKIIQSCNGKPIFDCKEIIKSISFINIYGVKRGKTRRYFFEKITDLGEYSMTLTKEDYDRAVPIVK